MKRSDGNGSARRTKTKRPGIYYRDTPRGRRYEITFLDEDGRRRWQAVDGNLEAAQAALDERRRRRRVGETVAPEKVRLADYSKTWLAQQTHLRPRTRDLYESNLDRHVLPKLGHLFVHEIREDDVVSLVATMGEKGLSGYTIKGALTPLNRILNAAVRRRMLPSNPIARLERSERPKVEKREMRVLNTDEISRLLDVADEMHRPLLATAIFTGLRQGELLGLTWADVGFDDGVIRVRRQLDRSGQRVAPKTEQAVRDVDLMPALGRLLKAHRERAFARGFAKPSDYVFASAVGTPLHYRNVSRRGLDEAVERAGLDVDGRPRLRFHDLRHTFASVLIAQGENVVYASRQLGHASTSITLDVYAHLFDRAEHGRRSVERLEESFGRLVGGDA